MLVVPKLAKFSPHYYETFFLTAEASAYPFRRIKEALFSTGEW